MTVCRLTDKHKLGASEPLDNLWRELHGSELPRKRDLSRCVNVYDLALRYPFVAISSEIAPTIAMDRGIATLANLLLLKERGFSHVVIERANKTVAYKEHFGQM
ncbi:MAG: hypothetical protein M0Z39_08700 [Actinomycetota bacterium]|nr:hypothetical protein [Actinomycetota bacterium]